MPKNTRRPKALGSSRPGSVRLVRRASRGEGGDSGPDRHVRPSGTRRHHSSASQNQAALRKVQPVQSRELPAVPRQRLPRGRRGAQGPTTWVWASPGPAGGATVPCVAPPPPPIWRFRSCRRPHGRRVPLHGGNRFVSCTARVSTIKPSQTDWPLMSGLSKERSEVPMMSRQTRHDIQSTSLRRYPRSGRHYRSAVGRMGQASATGPSSAQIRHAAAFSVRNPGRHTVGFPKSRRWADSRLSDPYPSPISTAARRHRSALPCAISAP